MHALTLVLALVLAAPRTTPRAFLQPAQAPRTLEPSHPASDPARHGFTAPLSEAANAAGLPVRVFDALVEHESRWRPGAVGGRDGQCIGLAQVCLHIYPACRAPGGGWAFAAPPCQAAKARLLDGVANLRTAGQLLGKWRAYCFKRTGHAEPVHVLSGYGGWDVAEGLVCGQRWVKGRWVTVVPRGVRDVLALVRR